MKTEAEKKQFSIRPSAEAHERLSMAASWRGQSLSAFVLGAAIREADEVLASRQQVVLTQEDATTILDLLDNPPRPNEAMAEALRLHAQIVQQDRGQDL